VNKTKDMNYSSSVCIQIRFNKRFPGKTTLHRGPRVLSKLTLSVIPLHYYSSGSLTMRKTPYPFLLLPRDPSLGLNSTRDKAKGGAAYRRRERSGEGWGWLREVLAVTMVYDSTTGVAGIVRSTRVGGCSRRRRVLRPNHGDLVQSNGTASFTG
jgi:hypothetical protein